MKKLLLSTAVILMASTSAFATPVVGEAAPIWTGTDIEGVEHTLTDFAGKTVVMEWNNPECPYVVKHYDSGNMQALQKDATDQDVVWVTINSGAEGKQGHMSAKDAKTKMTVVGSNASAYILDPSGEIGKMYDAKTTPHMFVINPEGTLVYAGAIDSDPSFKQETIEGATNYITAALSSIKAGEPIEISSTQPYGCSVKY